MSLYQRISKLVADALARLVQRHRPRKPVHPVKLTQTCSRSVAEIDTRYLSFSIDISLLAGGHWWEGAMDTRRGLGTLYPSGQHIFHSCLMSVALVST